MVRLLPILIFFVGLQQLGLRTNAIPFQGVNLAGLEFYVGGQDTDSGYVDLSYPYDEYLGNENHTFEYQIKHFTARGYNMFRIPFAWQRLQPQHDGVSRLNTTYLKYIQDAVTDITRKNASAIIDVHNYARVQGQIIGQGGPTSPQFAKFWVQLAQIWSSYPNVWFGLMNEPHDLNITIWGETVQLAVNSIRTVANNTILLPGTDFTGLSNWLTESYPTLRQINDPHNNASLVYDIHHYWDGDGGNLPTCSDTTPDKLFPEVTLQLAKDRRWAFLSETGGGNGSSCVPYLNSTLQQIDNPSWLGHTAWGAGEFAATPQQYSHDFAIPGPANQTPDALTLSPNPTTGKDTPQFSVLDAFRGGLLFCICGSGYCPGNSTSTRDVNNWSQLCTIGNSSNPIVITGSGNPTSTSITTCTKVKTSVSAGSTSAASSTAAATSSKSSSSQRQSVKNGALWTSIGMTIIMLGG